MADDAHGSTTIIEKYAPGLAWLPRWMRGHFTPKVAWTVVVIICSAVISVATKIVAHEIRVGMRDARMDALESSLSQLRTEVRNLPKPSPVTAEQFNALKSAVDEMNGRWKQVDSVPEGTPRGRHAKHP